MAKIERLRLFLVRILSELTPSDAAWKGAATGVFVLVAVLVLAYFATYFMQDFTWQKLPAFPARTVTLFSMEFITVRYTIDCYI